MASHLGVSPSDHVILHLTGSGDWERSLPDGSAVYPFEIPVGRYLVITDVDWQFAALSGVARQNVTLRLFVAPRSDPKNGYPVHESTALLDDNGYGGASEAMTTGFVVDRSATIRCDCVPVPQTISNIVLRGYLIDIK